MILHQKEPLKSPSFLIYQKLIKKRYCNNQNMFSLLKVLKKCVKVASVFPSIKIALKKTNQDNIDVSFIEVTSKETG